MPIPKAQEVKLSDVERQGLEKLVKRHQVGQQIALRAKIVLAAAGGMKNKEIVAKYSVTADTTRLWRNRWVKLQDISLISCDSQFAPIILASDSSRIISTSADLPKSLSGKVILWSGGVLNLYTNNMEVGFPEDTFGEFRLSFDHRYMIYLSHFLSMGEGLPEPGDYAIKVLDLQTDKRRRLVSKNESFPDAVLFSAPTFSPSGDDVFFIVAWKNSVDLVKVNAKDGTMERLYVDVLLTNFGRPDVSSNGEIVVICKGPGQNTVSELCLLDENGKFIRYLTSEGKLRD